MKLPANYYHCFLGNGLDAVLIGYSGSMVPDKVGVDRCSWYKSDRYYPEEKLVHVAGRFPMEKKLEHGEGSGWFELAPLGRAWYEVSTHSKKLEIQTFEQHFVPREGTLYTHLDFGSVQAEVTTFMDAAGSLLVEHYDFSAGVDFTACMAPGVWVEDGWDTSPFNSVSLDEHAPTGAYDIGETQGAFFMHLEPAPAAFAHTAEANTLSARGRTFTRYFSILDNRQGSASLAEFQQLISPGYPALFARHKKFWKDYFSVSSVHIPDQQLQESYDASQYHIKAAQNPQSGGLPVNNLRRTWSSHIFWDSYYLQRALIESNHIPESLEGCRFFERTAAAAKRHAEVEFGCDGLKWDWEVTHDGRKAYGSLLHMKFQVHNNGSYANELWQHYRFTRDETTLREFFPILEGLAVFFIKGIVLETPRGWEIGPLVGVHESPIKVRNEGTSLAATIDILEHYADAARILGVENDFSAHCRVVAHGLRQTLGLLFNGEFFVSAEGLTNFNASSTAVVYPLEVIPPQDLRAAATAREVIRQIDGPHIHNGHEWLSGWHAGVCATIIAMQGDGDNALRQLNVSRPCICQFGGITEVMIDGEWNMQYFLTAQGAVMTGIHALLLQGDDQVLSIFPALPHAWTSASFDHLLNNGLSVSASLAGGKVTATVKNIAPLRLERTVKIGSESFPIHLDPRQEVTLHAAY